MKIPPKGHSERSSNLRLLHHNLLYFSPPFLRKVEHKFDFSFHIKTNTCSRPDDRAGPLVKNLTEKNF